MIRKIGDPSQAVEKSPTRSGAADPAPARRTYLPPRLTCYGNVRDLTAAPSPGAFESGPGAGFKAV